MLSIACRRFILRAAEPDWLVTGRGLRAFLAALLAVLVVNIVLTAVGYGPLVPLVTWAMTLPVVVPGIVRLRQQNRRRVRRGEPQVGRDLPALYLVGWCVMIMAAVVQSAA